MIVSLLRSPTSYFRPYRNYFLAIYAFFLAFPARELALFTGASSDYLRYSTRIFVLAAVVIAVLWGYLTTKLYYYPQNLSLNTIISNPRRPINLGFLIYLVPMVATFVASFLDDSILAGSHSAKYLLSGESFQAVEYSSLFLSIAGTVIVAFVTFPLAVLVSLRSQLKDEEIRHELLLIATCFGTVSVLLLAFNALTNIGYSILGAAHVACVGLLFVVVRAFSRPTFLKAFLGIIPTLGKLPGKASLDQIAIIYKNGEDKARVLSKFVREGIAQNEDIAYFYAGNEADIREQLAGHRVDFSPGQNRENFQLFPVSGLYGSSENMDPESPFRHVSQLVSAARASGRTGLTLILDYGDYLKQATHEIVQHITDHRWTLEDHYLKTFLAIAETALDEPGKALPLLESRVNVVDLSQSADFLSRTMGISHGEIAGKKILMKLDPLGDYERALNSLIAEVTANFERAAVFTRRDSALYSAIREQNGLKMFVLTSRVSYPKIERENRVLLPAYDSSLLLDAINRTTDHFSGSSLTLVFDSISHFIHTLGPERAYSLVRQALELIISDKITGVFLVNTEAHDEKILSMFENLFDAELLCRTGERAPTFRRKLSVAN